MEQQFWDKKLRASQPLELCFLLPHPLSSFSFLRLAVFFFIFFGHYGPKLSLSPIEPPLRYCQLHACLNSLSDRGEYPDINFYRSLSGICSAALPVSSLRPSFASALTIPVFHKFYFDLQNIFEILGLTGVPSRHEHFFRVKFRNFKNIPDDPSDLSYPRGNTQTILIQHPKPAPSTNNKCDKVLVEGCRGWYYSVIDITSTWLAY